MIRFHKDIAQEIFNWLLENQFTNERVNACHEQFSRYIYDSSGNYAAGGQDISDFIIEADRLVYESPVHIVSCLNSLIEKSSATDIPIGVIDEIRKRYILELAKDMKVTIPEPVVINDLSELNAHGDIYIDSIDRLLKKLTDGKVKDMTTAYNGGY